MTILLRTAALSLLVATFIPRAVAQEPASSAAGAIRGELPVPVETWVGDFDGMVQRRLVRALVVYSKTQYFFDRGTPYDAAYELLNAFEDHLNKTLKTTSLQLHVTFVPTSRDDLIPSLLEGRGDIGVAGLTMTPGRQQRVDFSTPMFTGISEIVVAGPQSPALATLDDLAGREVFVRKSSSY